MNKKDRFAKAGLELINLNGDIGTDQNLMEIILLTKII